MPVCAVKLCRNYVGKPYNNTKITFHRFPTDSVLANSWREIIQRTRNEEQWKPHKTSVVCSEHFSYDDLYFTKKGLRRLKNGSVPTKCLFLSATETESSTNIKQDPSASYMAIDICNQIIEPKPSCSKELVSDEPTTVLQDFSDLESIFDTPRKVKLRRTLRRKIILECKHRAMINSLRKKNIRLKKQNTSFKCIIKTLQNQRLINEDVHNVLERNLFVANLYSQMSKKIKGQGNRPAKYSPEFRKFCLTLHFLSPRAYSYVRRKFETCLPHPKTLTKWYCNIDGSPGLTEDAFQTLKSKREKSEKNLICALIADEMAIRQQKCWNNKTYKDDGLVDIGTGPDENINKTASEAYVFILVSLNEPWKLPVAYFLIHGLTGVQKSNIIKIILERCNDVGVDVVSLTFDGHPTNLSAMQILGCDIKCDPRHLKTTFKHPYAEYDVAVFLDPCHMVKLIRNNFESKECFLNENKKEIRWEYVKKLCDLQSETGLHLANKLTKKHIYFRNSVMNVKLAAQLLSRSVAKAIEFCRVELKIAGFEDSKDTEEFIMLINNVFDIFNSRNLSQHGFCHPLLISNKEEVFEFLEKAKECILKLGLKVSRKRSFKEGEHSKTIIIKTCTSILKSQVFTGFLGLLIDIESLKKLYDSLIPTKKLKYLTTYRLSQDHIELFFGAIRLHGGYNDNPNARQFKGIYRKLLCHMELKTVDSGNCVPLESVSILTCTSAVKCINETTSQTRAEDENECDTVSAVPQHILTQTDISLLINPEYTDYFEQVVGYIAGFVVQRICRLIKCSSCIQAIKSNEILKFHKLVSIRDEGGLVYASEDAFKICKVSEYVIRDFIKQGHIVTSSSNYYKKICLKIISQYVGHTYFKNIGDCCQHHQTSLLRLIIEKYLQIRCHYICKSDNIAMAIKSKRKLFRKQTQRDGF